MKEKGTGRVSLLTATGNYLNCMTASDGVNYVYINAPVPGPSTSFTVHRLGVPPPIPQGPYHIYTPPHGHPGQRKYLAFTGAIECPKCRTVLGVDPNVVSCQCPKCHSNIIVRYAKPIQTSKRFQEKHRRHSGSGLSTGEAVLCGVVGGVLLACVLDDLDYDMGGSREFIGDDPNNI